MKHHCPICGRPTDSDVHAAFPFCGERCRLLDLGHWAAERYVVSEPAFEEGGAEPRDPRKTDEDDSEN